MLLDNETRNEGTLKKQAFHIYFEKRIKEGNLRIVTGYFTVNALYWLVKNFDTKIDDFQFVLGEITNTYTKEAKVLNLLNQDLGIDKTIKMSKEAKVVIEFLKQDKVKFKTLEPNFCHAKLYIFDTKEEEDNGSFYVLGSSNLTGSGIGLNTKTSNIELNHVRSGGSSEADHREVSNWFTELWNKPQAHTTKNTIDEKGNITKIDFKEYLIREISRLFKIYTPTEIYHKILFELFYQEEENKQFEKEFGRLENTIIYNHLYPFQKNAVHSLLKMLEKYNGAILADAVGLGKTWTTLAIIKFYQLKGHETIVLCPKKLEQNWQQYKRRKYSIFEEDKFDYLLRFHTDLREEGMYKKDISLDYFDSDTPKLFVIDESHNLRNDKSARYKHLVEEILQTVKGDIKVLLLSATPINNSFKDVRNQFKLLVKGQNNGFEESLDVKNLEYTFREVQTAFNGWSKKNAKLSDFHTKISNTNFFKLTDHLLVARTRKNIISTTTSSENTDENKPILQFPIHKKPINIFKTPMRFGDVENFAELMEKLKLKLSAYQPHAFTITLKEEKQREKDKQNNKKQEKDAILEDQIGREKVLVTLMIFLMLKRLESSWCSFKITVERICEHHTNALKQIEAYKELKEKLEKGGNKDTEKLLSQTSLETDEDKVLDQDEIHDEHELEDFILGKKKELKKQVSIKQIDEAGRLDEFRKLLIKDKQALQIILLNVSEFEKKMEDETKKDETHDPKLQELLDILNQKATQENKKVIIFSAYKDTVDYLFTQLKKRGFTNFASVAGSNNQIWNTDEKSKKHEPILERFAPFTKLFKEKKWTAFETADLFNSTKGTAENYKIWQNWIKNNDTTTNQKLQNPIDILITTDVLSEGQNLQDADMVINYDIHWNPVRVVQRVGRIDRIGSPNAEIQSINFWPSKDIDDYINLKSRVEKRMTLMKLVGSEVITDFTEEFGSISEDEELEKRQTENLLRQMQDSLEDLDGEKSIGFDDFSFDNYRQSLQEILNQKQDELKNLPNGIFSGIKISIHLEDNKNNLAESNPMQSGIIALLGYPKNTSSHLGYTSKELIYVDYEGNPILNNQKIILEQLQKYHYQQREVNPKIDAADTETLAKLSFALKKWIENQAITKDEETGKEVAGISALQSLKALQGKKGTIGQKTLKKVLTQNVNEKYNSDNFDLLTWLVVDVSSNDCQGSDYRTIDNVFPLEN